MVDGVPFRDGAVVLQRVDVVVAGADPQFGLQEAGSDEHQARRDDQLPRLGGDEERTLIGPRSDLDHSRFQRRLVQVSHSGLGVRVYVAGHQRVGGGEQGLTIAADVVGVEAVVQNRRALHLLGVGHGPRQRLGVPRGQGVIEVVLDGLLGQAEPESDGFVVVASGERFLPVVVGNGGTFVLHRSRREAGQLGFFFKGTLRGFDVENLFVLLAVAIVLQTEQRVQTGEQFLQKLCARNSHFLSTPRIRRCRWRSSTGERRTGA